MITARQGKQIVTRNISLFKLFKPAQNKILLVIPVIPKPRTRNTVSSTLFDLDFFDEEENVVKLPPPVIQQQEEHQPQPAAVPSDDDFEDANDAVLAQPDPELPHHTSKLEKQLFLGTSIVHVRVTA